MLGYGTRKGGPSKTSLAVMPEGTSGGRVDTADHLAAGVQVTAETYTRAIR